MADYKPEQIKYDQGGEPVGLWRLDQDPDEAYRVHPIEKTNVLGDPVVDGNGDPVIVLLPLDHPKVVAALEARGLVNKDGVLVAADEHVAPTVEPGEALDDDGWPVRLADEKPDFLKIS